MDGTFDQEAPFRLISGKKTYYSYDLSAATDRLPLRVLYHVMESLFGSEYASAVVNSTLACHTFQVPFVRGPKCSEKLLIRSVVSFVVGQPLGYYSSWPLFALSHHVLVWVAADRVYPGMVFRDYAVLGDDIVIADEGVSREYRSIMDALQVKISDTKSLVSHTGAAEFAKRFFVKGLSVDCSPISLKNLLGCHHPKGILSLWMRYPNLPEKVVWKLMGMGYRSLAKIDHRLPKKYDRVRVMMLRYRLPLPLWLGGMIPLSPYLTGYALWYLIERI